MFLGGNDNWMGQVTLRVKHVRNWPEQAPQRIWMAIGWARLRSVSSMYATGRSKDRNASCLRCVWAMPSQLFGCEGVVDYMFVVSGFVCVCP